MMYAERETSGASKTDEKMNPETIDATVAQWNAVLNGEGLQVVKPEAVEVGEDGTDVEFQRVFDFNGETDVEAGHIEPAETGAEEELLSYWPRPEAAPVLSETEFGLLERIRGLGHAATIDEADATPESVIKLIDAGFVQGRIREDGIMVLAGSGATERDVWIATNRQECDDLADQFLKDVVTCDEIAAKILARVEKLGACTKEELSKYLEPLYSADAVTPVLKELTRRGEIRQAMHKDTEIELVGNIEADGDTFARAMKRFLKLEWTSAENRKRGTKTFAEEASGSRPSDDEAPEDRFAAERAAQEFRHAGRVASGDEKLSPAETARRMLAMIELSGTDTSRNLVGGRTKPGIRVGTAILRRLVDKDLIEETVYRSELAYTTAYDVRPKAVEGGGTIPESIARKLGWYARRAQKTRKAFQKARQNTSSEQIAWATARAAFLAEAKVSEKVTVELLKNGEVLKDDLARLTGGDKVEIADVVGKMAAAGLVGMSQSSESEEVFVHLASDGAKKAARKLVGKQLLDVIADPGSGISFPENGRISALIEGRDNQTQLAAATPSAPNPNAPAEEREKEAVLAAA